MESNKTLWIFVIVAVSTLVTILTPVESKCVPLRDSFVARSLLHVLPPSNPPSESESPSPAPAPEVTEPINSPANPPSDIDSPAASPEIPADSISPSEIDTDSPAESPEAPAESISPANPPTEIDLDFPASSPESPADSISPTNSPSETDLDSPAASPDSPAGLISPTNPPSQENSVAPSGKTLMNTPKNLLNQPLLSPKIKTICSKTDHPPLCESSVTPLLTPELKPDTSSVLVIAIQASINATKAAMATVDKVAAADCQELYDDAVANLEDAINAVKSRDIATVNTNLSAAMTDYGTCNDGFEETGEPNPLADVGDKLTKMVSNCLAISTLIK